jgi:sugar lactone lactonase YvrE
MTRRLRSTMALGIAAAAAAAILVAVPAAAAPTSVTTAKLDLFPTEIALPNGWLPEGIAIGVVPYAFFGSRADGDLYRANLITGEGTVFSQGPGTPSVGLKVDLHARLFVAGGTGGDGRVVHAFSGKVLAEYTFAEGPPTFVNDVVLTDEAAWFTDSQRPALYKVPLGVSRQLPDQDDVETLTLSGDWVQTAGNNANGIAQTPDGSALLVVQSSTGLLFRVDPVTGNAQTVDLGGELLTNGDGLLLDGRTLFAVQNRLNQVAVIDLNEAGTAGEIVDHLTDPRFDVPTTVAAWGNRLYLPNARFTTPPTPTTPYNAVAIPKP